MESVRMVSIASRSMSVPWGARADAVEEAAMNEVLRNGDMTGRKV
jgi:hypothetical protein